MARRYKLETLSKLQLKRLRNDIVLNSLYYADYRNRYNIDCHQVCDFFDGYADYLGERMQDNGINTDESFFVKLSEYDTIDNLLEWHNMLFG